MWDSNTVEDEIQRNSLEYGVAVNTDRSIPDAKSGLKPVARRILYDAFIEGRTSDKPHVKSARIVGDVMGRLHPHGDSSIYGAMIRLSQSWVMRYPLIDVHGNNGTILGDGPAASRYTEARLAKIAEDGLLCGLKKQNVDFVPNYDETEEEPITLPSIFPNLLCNPNEGIGWAMGCSWAPHNLREVTAAIVTYLNGEEPMLPGPDFPTGGVVINKDDIPAIMKSGKGSVKIRGKYEVKGNNIIFTEIPYGTRLESLMEEIGEACDKGDITGVSEVRNETGKKSGLRLVIQTEKNANVKSVLNQLFAKTNLQTTFAYNQVALVGKTPVEMNLKDAIKIYIEHNIDCLVRETQFDLNKAEARLEIVNGLLKALEDINNIIKLIKSSESAAAAKIALIDKYDFTEPQAKAIIEMKLGRLAHIEKIEVEKEQKNLTNTIDGLNTILASRESQIVVLMSRLVEINEKYGDARRTELTQINEESNLEKKLETIIPKNVVVIISKDGDVKRVPKTSFRVQNANGKGIKSVDNPIATISTNTLDNLLVFTSAGKVYQMIVDDIPEGTNVSKGAAINSLTSMSNNEYPVAAISMTQNDTNKYLLFITKNGIVKKTEISEYTSIKRKCGVAAIKLREGDSILKVILTNDEDDSLMMATKNGTVIRIKMSDIGAQGRMTMGVQGINIRNGDSLLTGFRVNHNDKICFITEDGHGKKIAESIFVNQMRGGIGVITSKTSLASAFVLPIGKNVLCIGASNSICVNDSDIPEVMTRSAAGNMLSKTNVIIAIPI